MDSAWIHGTLPRFLRTAVRVEVIMARKRPAAGREVDRDVRRHRPAAALTLESGESRGWTVGAGSRVSRHLPAAADVRRAFSHL